MNRYVGFCLAILVMASIWAQSAEAQQRASRPRPKGQRNEKQSEKSPVPVDKRLLAIHRDFVDKAQKLALEYERGNDLGKARAVYQEILKLVPQHAQASTKIHKLLERELNAQKTVITVDADKAWQDTGVIVIKGKPVQVRADGQWTFHLKMEVDADGIKIPDKLREYNLGCLMGAIRTRNGKLSDPFVVGAEHSVEAEHSGRLYLRMYDIFPNDNEGLLEVEIRGGMTQRK